MESSLKGHSFRIRCDVTVLKEICVDPTAAKSLTVPPSDLHQHLGALLDSEVGKDVTFDVGGEQFTGPHGGALRPDEGEHHVKLAGS